MESGRSSAYDEDLRWRMVWQRYGLGNSYDQIARNLCVDKATVWRTANLFNTTGKVSKRPYPKERAFRKLTAPAQLLVLHLVCSQPGISLNEIQYELEKVLLLKVSISTICRCLYNSGFTRQKLQITASQ